MAPRRGSSITPSVLSAAPASSSRARKPLQASANMRKRGPLDFKADSELEQEAAAVPKKVWPP